MLARSAIAAQDSGSSSDDDAPKPTLGESRGGHAPERMSTRRELLAAKRMKALNETTAHPGPAPAFAEETKADGESEILGSRMFRENETSAKGSSRVGQHAAALANLAKLRGGSTTKLTSLVEMVKRRNNAAEQERLLKKLHAQKSAADIPVAKSACCPRVRSGCMRLQCLVIREESWFLRAWDSWFVFALVWIVIRVPFIVAFLNDAPSNSLLTVIDGVAELSFILDMILRFFTEYKDDGDDVLALPDISYHYITTWFVADVIASFPYTLVRSGTVFSAFKFLRLLRMAKVEYFEQRLSTWLELSPTSQVLLRLVKLMTYMLMSAHVTACLWFFIATLENDPDNTWTYLYGVDAATWQDKYISSVYWSFVTLTTVGYGDISAHTNAERLFSLVMLAMGAAMFATLVGKISALSAMLNEKQSEGSKRRDAVTYYLKSRSIPKYLRKRTRTYYEYISHLDTFLNEEHMLDDLSPPLRRAVSVFLNQALLSDVPVLRSADPAFQAAIVRLLRPTVVLSGEYVICAGDVGYEMYILRVGQVAVLAPIGTQLYVLGPGSFFGEDQLLYRQRAAVSCVARSHCEMYRLQRANFQALIEDFPQFEATLRGIATERKLYHREVAKKKRKSAEPSQVHDDPPPGYNSWQDVADLVHQQSMYPTGNKMARNRVMAAIEYIPHPLDFSDFDIPEQLQGLLDAVTMNMHEVWAQSKVRGGWRFGLERDNTAKYHPDLIPYDCMSESAREFDAKLSRSIVRHMLGRGYSIYAGALGAKMRQWLECVQAEADRFREARSQRPDHDPPTYSPKPFNILGVSLAPALKLLTEEISHNIHEVWAEDRIKHGWQWGPNQNDALKQHPGLLPYRFLSNDEKKGNLEPVVMSLKMVVAVGYRLVLGQPIESVGMGARSGATMLAPL